MNKIGLVIITSWIGIWGCNTDQESERPYSGPVITETKGDVVTWDSMGNPVVVEVDYDKLEKVRAGKPKIVPLRSNVYPAGTPKVVKAGKPRICTPGQDTFSLPQKVIATFKTVLAETPEIMPAKEASSKDENPYSFSSLGVKNGLKNNCIRSIYEDKTGNIWIGMCDESGITKYDGKYYTNYNKNKSLFRVWSILEDKKGNIWFGGGGSVLKFDGKYYTTFTNIDKLVTESIISIFEDKAGNIWMGTNGNGLLKFDGMSLTHFTKKQGLSNDYINKIIQDKNGNIWLGTDDGISKFDGKAFYNYGENEGLSHTLVYSMQEDKSGHLWLGTLGGGVFKFDQENFVQYTEKEGLGNNYISSSTLDLDKNLWFHSDRKSISKFDEVYFTNFINNEGFKSISGQSILCDKHKQIWLGTFTDGVIKNSGNHFQHLTDKDGILSNTIAAVLKDKSDDFWFGGYGGGVLRIDKNYIMQITKKEGLYNDHVWSMYLDKSKHLWIGTDEGLLKYDGKYFTKMTPKNGLYEIWVYSIYEDIVGNLWIGTGKGLIKYSGNLMTYFSDKNDFGNKTIFAMIGDKKNNIWLGTNTGISKLTPFVTNDSVMYSITNFTEKHGLGKGDVRSIFEDSCENIWVGTMNGLSRINESYKKNHYSITNITTKEGLSSNEIFSIYQDKEENLWFGTYSGLDKLTPEKLKLLDEKISSKSISDSDVFFKNYNQSDGFLGIGVLGGKTIQEDKNGKIWIGSLDRLTIYDPKGESSDTASPNVQLIGLSIYNENMDWIDLENKKDTTITLGNGVRFKNFDFDSTGKWYGVPQNLSLASNNNYVTFRFVGVTQNQPHKVKYKYRLAGLDDNWSALTDKNEAQFGNLSYGKYTFMVKSMNGDGVWSEPLTYTFSIRPPWYLTWWAYSVYLALFLFAGQKLHVYQKAKTIKKEREKALARELEHAREIEIAYTKLGTAHENLKSTQAQLIQSEKMASLGELTAGIAHEIQNPLNFVNNFSEVSKELLGEMKTELDNGHTKDAKELADDVMVNLDKISHHGKRASDIVKGMLEHSRKSTGEKESTDINALCDEYLRLGYHGLKAKDKDFNATMETHFDPNLPKIDVIPQDIGRVLLNLINNAFYAVNERSKKDESDYVPTVTVTTELTDNSQLLISVKDNGSGIPDAIKDKIFQPFFTTKPTGQGTGLGLSLSYDIVKAHGGELKVETKEGEGSKFSILLPV